VLYAPFGQASFNGNFDSGSASNGPIIAYSMNLGSLNPDNNQQFNNPPDSLDILTPSVSLIK